MSNESETYFGSEYSHHCCEFSFALKKCVSKSEGFKDHPVRLGGFVECGHGATLWSLRSAGYQHVKCIPVIMCFMSYSYPWARFLLMFQCTLYPNPWNSLVAISDLCYCVHFNVSDPAWGSNHELRAYLSISKAEIQPECKNTKNNNC